MEGKAFVSLITDVLDDADIATIKFLVKVIFSSPGQSPGRAIVLPPASALAAALAKC